jgi:uncharacterized membrane protein
MLRSFRNAFFAGLVALLPLGITLFILLSLVHHVGAPIGRLCLGGVHGQIPGLIRFSADLLSTLLVVAFVAALGWISRYFLGRFFIRSTERLITRLPIVRSLYNTSKQIVATFSDGRRAIFQKVVLVEFPHGGAHSIGLLTGEAGGEIAAKVGATLCVFVPTTPNPTSGFLIFVPADRCIPLAMSVADAMKAIISGGALVPPEETAT